MLSRLFILILSCFFFMNTQANNGAKVATVSIGSEYQQALKDIKAEFGEPTSIQEQAIEFKNMTYHNFKFDLVIFKFKNDKLNEARFFMRAKNKIGADKKVEALSKELGKKHPLSEDYEDGSYFYKGGLSPKGIGHLFTISTAKRQGVWNAELTYGPF